jgi:hypothetical protein
LASQLGSPKHFQLSTDSFHRGHVASPPAWTHFEQHVGELVNAGLALLVVAGGEHALSLRLFRNVTAR